MFNPLKMAGDLKGIEKMLKPALEKFIQDSGFVKDSEFRKLEKNYKKNKKPIMLLVSKSKSYDKSFKGDFNLNSNNEISRQKNNKFIFTGAQIINRSVFKHKKIKPFSMNIVWNDLIKNKRLIGIKSKQKFFHINNYKIYKKL